MTRNNDASGVALTLDGLPSLSTVWDWIERINSFGPRMTGNTAQARAIDFLAGEFQAMGIDIHRDSLTMRRWTPMTTALALSNGEEIAVAAPYPYSGLTPPDGVSGEMVLFKGRVRSFKKAQGKIAVVTVQRRDFAAALMKVATKRRSQLPEGTGFPDGFASMLITGTLGVSIQRAREDGVLGVVFILEGVSEAQLADQMLPFITPYRDIPAIWVTQAAGDRLKAAIDQGLHGRLTLDGSLDDVSTDTLYAVLPGTNPNETIIINTHTDGPNACEENGGAGVLALARHFSAMPRSARNRTLVFVLVTGHFQIPQFGVNGNQATSRWLKMHPELWDGNAGHAKAVAGVTIEHLGCLEWRDDLAKGRPMPTGKLELDLVFTANKAMDDVYVSATQGRNKLRALTVSPRAAPAMLGEGQPLYAAGIPTISNVPVPDYLCQILPEGGLDRLDPEYAYQQVETFARTVAILDCMPSKDIGGVPSTLVARTVSLMKRVLKK